MRLIVRSIVRSIRSGFGDKARSLCSEHSKYLSERDLRKIFNYACQHDSAQTLDWLLSVSSSRDEFKQKIDSDLIESLLRLKAEQVLCLLITSYEYLFRRTGYFYQELLHQACQFGLINLIELCSKKDGVCLNWNKDQALGTACCNQLLNIARYLIQYPEVRFGSLSVGWMMIKDDVDMLKLAAESRKLDYSLLDLGESDIKYLKNMNRTRILKYLGIPD